MLARPSLALLLLLGAGFAFAQDKAPEGASAGDLGKANDEDVPANGVAPGKYLDTARESVDTMRTSLSKGLDELKEAREKKDAVQLTCVNEQVTAMKGILR